LRQDETKTIELLINSSIPQQPEVTLYCTLYCNNDPSRPVLDFEPRNLTMPSYGFASNPVTIKTSRDTEIAPHSGSIYANSTFPFEFIRVNKTASAGTERSLEIKGEDKITQSSFMIDVEAPLSLTDQISEFWNS
jgi:hypothetical protein